MDERNKAIGQRINLSYHIQPLDELETVNILLIALKLQALTEVFLQLMHAGKFLPFLAEYHG